MGYGLLVSFWVTHNLETCCKTLCRNCELSFKVSFENVCRLETLVFETVSRLSSSSHLSKGNWRQWSFLWSRSWLPDFWVLGLTSKGYQVSTPLACDLGNPKLLNLGSFKHNPKQTETTFQICFSNAFQLGILASELQGSRSSSVVLSSKPLVISPSN